MMVKCIQSMHLKVLKAVNYLYLKSSKNVLSHEFVRSHCFVYGNLE